MHDEVDLLKKQVCDFYHVKQLNTNLQAQNQSLKSVLKQRDAEIDNLQSQISILTERHEKLSANFNEHVPACYRQSLEANPEKTPRRNEPLSTDVQELQRENGQLKYSLTMNYEQLRQTE